MWLSLAFLSAALLGFYDVFKKYSLRDNAVIPVLFLNTLFCSLIFLPFILLSATGSIQPGSLFHVPAWVWEEQRWVMLKAVIVLSSWLFGYFAIKHLPITIVGPINATRPVMTLVGALLVFGEQLNGWQWAGVSIAIASFYLLSRSGKKEGIRFAHNRWIYFLIAAALLGAASGLYDKFLMTPLANGGRGLANRAGTTSTNASSWASSCCSSGCRCASAPLLSAGDGASSASPSSSASPTSPISMR